MNLYLMRHGQAADPLEDPQQGLTAAGRAAIEALAQRLLPRGVCFKQVWHSDKARARQTAEIMAAILAPGVTPRMRRGLKPNDDPADLIAEIERWDEDTLIASHLPFVPTLVAELTGQPVEMGLAPGTIICLQHQDPAWRIVWQAVP
ncbi:MAG: phosphohistidine phosphatase SixA [Gammaproteobacteria bacterium]